MKKIGSISAVTVTIYIHGRVRMKVLIKNTRLVDEAQDTFGDIYIEDGLIKEIGVGLEKKCKVLVIDGKGLVTMPSFIDLHVHLRDPGLTHKEDIESGSRAALRGGYTLVNAMGNTKPIASTMEVVDYVLKKSKDLDLIDIHQTVSLTKDFDGKTLDHLDRIDREKVKFISDDGFGVISNIVMYKAMEKAVEKDFTIMTHAEDMDLTEIDYRISENIITFRDLYLSQVTGARLHMSHVSTKEAIEGIRLAKKNGVRVTCEVSPHHISLYDENYRVNPPIRAYDDVKSIIEGIKDGTVDAIATDHAPHTKEDKEKGSPGMTGLELAFPLVYTKLKDEAISLSKISQLMSGNPARIFDVNKGKIQPGYDGDLVLVDLEKEFTVDSSKFVSKGKNTPFEGKKLTGLVAMTLKGGQIKYRDIEYEF